MKHLAGLLFSILILAAAITLYTVLALRITGNDERITAAKDAAATLDVEEHALAAQSGFIAGTSGERAALASYVIAANDALRIIDILDATAASAGVHPTIGAINTEATDWKYHDDIEVTVSTKGSYAQVARFAAGLETLPVASALVSANLQASADNSWFGTFIVDFVKEKSVPQSS